jgi:putative ABC transport system permease protein
VLLASWLTRLLVAVAPAGTPNIEAVRVDGRVLEGQGLGEPTEGACQAIVNLALARRLWPDGGAVGSRLIGPERPCTVVGIVSDVRERTPRAEPVPTFYIANHGGDGLGVMLVRSSVAPESLIPAIRRIMRDIDREVPIAEIAPVGTLMGRTLASERYRAIPLALFAVATLVLAVVGTYGVIARIVRRETRSLGIRAALGAGPSQLVSLVVREAAVVAAVGVTVGTAGALAVSGVLASCLFGIQPTDPATYVAASGVLGLLTLLAGYVPARAVSRMDFVTVLRAE